MHQKPGFRPEINGIRGIAVLVVIFFHLNAAWLPLGFLGVDIFFVLSGFLITGIILKDLSKNSFSFSEFFARRVKRILPVLFVVLFVTTVIAIIIFSSPEFRGYTRSLRYAAAQISNFFFANNLGYFDTETKHHALLHTWSLAVEEQFYLIWPFLLWVCVKIKRLLIPFFILTIVASFATMIYLGSIESQQAFYMFYSRAWQLGLGALIATPAGINKLTRKANNCIGLLSLSAIIIPLIPYSQLTNHTTASQIIVCLGVCGIIYSSSTHHTIAKSLLSAKWLLYIGAISYSLYLWHWPTIVFYNYIREAYHVSQNVLITPSLSFIDVSTILLITWALSALSYRFVENKFRYSKTSNKKVFSYALVSIVSFALLAKTLQKHNENTWRITPFNNQFSLSSLEIITPVTFDKAQPPEDILLIGDSHACHFTPMIKTWAQQHKLTAKTIYRGGTPSIITPENEHPMLSYRQALFNGKLKQYITENPHIRYVVIAIAHSTYATHPLYQSALEQTVSFLISEGKQVCLIAQTPPLKSSLIRHLEPTHFMRWKFPHTVSHEKLLAFDPHYVDQRLQPMRAIINNLTQKFPTLHVWHPEHHIHSGIYQGIPCYSDSIHLNMHGSLHLVPHFDFPLENE